jgi:holo-[acyl-carrier protein] synthase
MIGLGVDLVQISQLQSQLRDSASVFATETYTSVELNYAKNNVSGHPERHLAARYAAKEALIKAWSSLRYGKPQVVNNPKYKDVEVINDHFGRPKIRLSGSIREHLQDFKIQLSLSHDGDYAIATVLLFQEVKHA